MYVYVSKKIDRMMDITSHRGNIKLTKQTKHEFWKRRLRQLDVRKCVHHLSHVARVIESGKSDHRRDLEQTDLKSIRGSNLHTMCSERLVSLYSSLDGINLTSEQCSRSTQKTWRS